MATNEAPTATVDGPIEQVIESADRDLEQARRNALTLAKKIRRDLEATIEDLETGQRPIGLGAAQVADLTKVLAEIGQKTEQRTVLSHLHRAYHPELYSS